MSIQTQIDRLVQAKADLIAQISAKGVSVPEDASLDDLAALVQAISTGVDLPDLESPASGNEVFSGKEFITEDGEKVTGTFTVQPEITEQDALIAQIKTALQGKAGGSGGGGAGYEEGRHDGILSMVESVPTVLTESDLRGATKVREYCFYSNDIITSVELPDTVTLIEQDAFYQCSALTSFKLSNNLTELGTHALSRCYYIDWGNLVLPRTLQKIGDYAFWHCRKLPQVTIPESVTEIGLEAFNNGYTTTVIMESATPPTTGKTPFTHSRLQRILVPRVGVDAYKSATNWSDYGEKIFAREDYPEISGA